MLSTYARLPTGARQGSRSRRLSIVALSLFALCAQPGCAIFPAALPEQGPPPVVRRPGPDPVALGGIRVRVRSPRGPGVASSPTIDSTAVPTVVYLAADRALPISQVAEQVVEIGRSRSGLSPSFIAAAVKQSVKFRVADDIHHHIFSESKAGAFDLGSLGRGESQRVSFNKPGMLRLYCSLHPSESAALYVSPSPHFARVPASGEVSLGGLLPGRYQLHTWRESLPHSVVDVVVRAGAVSPVEIRTAGREERD